MASINSANIYFEAAQSRDRLGDPTEARNFYVKAAHEYAEIRKDYKDNPTLKFIDARIASCINSIEHYTLNKESARVNVGDNEFRSQKKFEIRKPDTTFDDVAGMLDLKEQLKQFIIWPLKYGETYKKFVKKQNFGVLLYGPPGCGKTYITEAAVGEANKEGHNISFVYVEPKDILDSWVGNSEKNMAAAFKFAAEHSPAVLFIDEIDGLGRSRSGKSIYADRLVNQFLASFSELKGKNVVVIGATNFPWSVDPALIRSGRLGARVYIGTPDLEARVGVFKVHNKGRPLGADIDYKILGDITESYTCSDIEQICDDAGIKALKNGGLTNKDKKIGLEEFKQAIVKTKPSIYAWCNKAAEQLRKQEVAKEFGDLVDIIKKYTGNGKRFDDDDGGSKRPYQQKAQPTAPVLPPLPELPDIPKQTRPKDNSVPDYDASTGNDDDEEGGDEDG